MDKIPQVWFVWNGETFKGMTVHVDVVPAFRCINYEAPRLLFGADNGIFYAVAKTFRHDYFP